jgi:hypothetical protein
VWFIQLDILCVLTRNIIQKLYTACFTMWQGLYIYTAGCFTVLIYYHIHKMQCNNGQWKTETINLNFNILCIFGGNFTMSCKFTKYCIFFHLITFLGVNFTISFLIQLALGMLKVNGTNRFTQDLYMKNNGPSDTMMVNCSKSFFAVMVTYSNTKNHCSLLKQPSY